MYGLTEEETAALLSEDENFYGYEDNGIDQQSKEMSADISEGKELEDFASTVCQKQRVKKA